MNLNHRKGKACSACGNDVRYIKSGKCVNCAKDYNRKNKAKNKERNYERLKVWRENNPERFKVIQQRCYINRILKECA